MFRLTIAVCLSVLPLGAMAQPASSNPGQYITGTLRAFRLQNWPWPQREATFLNANRQPVALSAFRGKVTLLVLWATWCGYCRREMPSLDTLQKELGPEGLQVVPVAIDKGGLPVVEDAYRERGYEALPLYIDPEGRVQQALGSTGVPYAFLLDAKGAEIGRVYGEVDWGRPEARSFLQTFLKNPG